MQIRRKAICLLVILMFFDFSASIFQIAGTIKNINASSVVDQGVLQYPLSSQAMPSMKGMTLNAWSAEAYNSSGFDQSVTNLASIKANWVLFTVFWFMNTSTTTEIQPRLDLYTASDSSLLHAIEKAQELNMRVALKPMVDVADGSWRGLISPTNWTLWFENYRNFINRYVDMAENNNVELFVVGTELVTSQSRESEWRQVISQVRLRYSRAITYAGNWDSYGTGSIKFWDALDYVGVDAYFPLTNSYIPTLSQLRNAWSYCTRSGFVGRNWTNELYLTYVQTGKKIVFTEIGYCSQNGTNMQPWNWNISPLVDLQEQADCYQAALDVFKSRTWFDGWFWWNWETDPNAGKPGTPDEKHYTPQNKPAQDVLNQYYYDAPPDFAITNITCSKYLAGRDDAITINVTAENQGFYSETLNITAYANSTIIQTREITLQNGSSAILSITWNTLGFVLGNYSIKAYAWPHPFETDTADNTLFDGWVSVAILHDIAVVDSLTSKNVVCQGSSMSISVNVENQGHFAETFNVTIYSNETLVATQSSALAIDNSTVLIFVWNTTSFAKGSYNIKAIAESTLDEDPTDNVLDNVWILVTMQGDIAADFGIVDIFDITTVALAFSSTPLDPHWNANADINNDLIIDIFDITTVALNFGATG